MPHSRPDQRIPPVPMSLLRLGAGRRLAVAAGLSGVLWLAVLWATA